MTDKIQAIECAYRVAENEKNAIRRHNDMLIELSGNNEALKEKYINAKNEKLKEIAERRDEKVEELCKRL